MVAPIALPAPATPLVGRADELTALVDTLTTPGARLVTLTGPPGVGKTRLALAAAGACSAAFAGDAFWVDLAPVREPRLVLPEIARALGVVRAVTEPAPATVAAIATAIAAAAVAAERDMLLVLDNCEHLLDAAPDVAALLAASPRLRILATSRERLRLAAEREFAVPPLLMPSDPEVGDLDRLRTNPAVALLLARAPAHVTLTARTARALADVCVRLDGLPLAIELAAARLRVFTPSELAFRLEHRMAPLAGAGARDSPGRHRDLRAAITWSHDLLPDAERAVFRRLSVFVGEWTVAAAEAVCADPSTPDVVDAVASLVDKSLIRRVAGEAADARFTMLVSLREFAAEQLEVHGETGETRERHARYIAAAARTWEAAAGTSEETAAWPLVAFIRGDLLAAFAHSRGGSDVDELLWLATGLGWYWYTRGSLADASGLLDVVSSAVADPRSSEEPRAAALLAAGVVAVGLGDLDTAERELVRCGTISERRGDRRRLAVVSAFRGHVARGRGLLEEARTSYLAARSYFDSFGDTRGKAWTAHDLGVLAAELGDVAEAESLLREAVGVFRSLDYEWAVAVSACALATVLLARGAAVEEPARLLGEALRLHEGVHDRRGIAQCLEGLADVALTLGSPATAARLLGAAAAHRTAVAARPTDSERLRLERLDGAVAGALGVAAADGERHAGRTMSVRAVMTLAATIAAGAVGPATGAAADSQAALGQAAVRPPGPDVALTPRQLEVGALVAAGSTNRQIGRRLGISEKTVEIHVRNIMERLDAPSRAGVASWVAERGLRPPPP